MTDPAVPAPPPPARHRRLRGALHLVFGLAVAVVVLWAVGGQRGELQGAVSYLENLKWQWVVMAAVTEFLAIVSFGALQRVLLEAGDVDAGLADMTTIAFAGNAIQNSLPAGPLWSNVWAFRQFRRRGAGISLAEVGREHEKADGDFVCGDGCGRVFDGGSICSAENESGRGEDSRVCEEIGGR